VTPYGVLRSPKEIMFGRGSIAALPKVVMQFGSRILVCTDANVIRHPAIEAALAELHAASSEVRVLDSIAPDLPLSAVQACLDAADPRTDVVVGLGGGSCMDAAKLVALLLCHPGPLELYYGENAVPGPLVPIVAAPTTAGTGSEVTPVAVVGDPSRQLKVGVSSAHLIPAVAICDPELTLSCPPSVTAFSGIDALAHAVEALTARARPRAWASYPGEIFEGSTVLTDDYARRAIRAIGSALERAYTDGSDLTARTEMLYGSLCAGLAFGNAGTAGAHALQYPIGAATATPHGLGVGLLLPYVLGYTAPACGEKLAEVARELGAEPTAQAAIAEIARLAGAVGVPRTLHAIGVREDALPKYAEQAATISRLAGNSPRELEAGGLLEILHSAYSGALVSA
jgi:alcohol dehydrogenase